MSGALSDAEMDALTAPKTTSSAPQQASLAPSGPLTDAEMDRLIAHPSAPQPGQGESFLRGVGGGATLEFGDELGLLDREKQKAAASSNPWTYAAGNIVGGLLPMTVLGPAGPVARLGSAGKALASVATPAASARAIGAMRQGAKAGAVWGGATGAGAAETDGMSWRDALMERLKGSAIGAAEGAAVGGALNAGIHGATRAIGAIGDKVLPGVREASAFAKQPENQGIRDVLMDARRDMVDFDTVLTRMTPRTTRSGGNSLTQAEVSRIVDLHAEGQSPTAIASQVGRSPDTVKNWIKKYETDIGRDFEGQNLLETMKTPAERGGIVTTKNLDDLATYAANMPGEGQNTVRTAMLQRKADQPSVLTEAVDRIFGTGDIEAFRRDVRQSGQQAFKELYGKFHDPSNVAPWPTMGHLAEGVTTDPTFRAALRRATQRARVEGAIGPNDSFGDIFSPAVIDYTAQVLREMGEAQGFSARHAQSLRRKFLETVDKNMEMYPQIRNMYRAHAARQEMLDAGQKFDISGAAKPGSRDAETLTALGEWTGKLRSDDPATQAMAASVVDAFKRGVGQSIKDLFESARNPMGGGTASALGKLQARNVEKRLREILPERDAEEMLAILARERRKIETGQTLYGNSKTAFRQEKSRSMDALAEIAGGIGTLRPGKVLRGTADLFTDRLREARANRINTLNAQTDMNTVRRLIMLLRDMDAARATTDKYIGGPARLSVGPTAATSVGALESK